MKTSARKRAQVAAYQAFTLVEVLTVLLIISILFALLMPALAAMRRAALRARAGTEAQSIASAIKQYKAIYESWPGQTQGATDTTYGTQIAQAGVIAALTNNPRGSKLLQIAAQSAGSQGGYMDPWNRPYVIAMDANNDGTTIVYCAVSVPVMTETAADTVAVASWGYTPSNTLRKSRIYSWKTF